MSLSNSSLPYKGVVQITTDSGTKQVCSGSLNYYARKTVCRHLGYWYFLANTISTSTNAKDETFSGSINCFADKKSKKYISQCSITASANDSCSELSYIQCKCGKIKLGGKKRIILWGGGWGGGANKAKTN